LKDVLPAHLLHQPIEPGLFHEQPAPVRHPHAAARQEVQIIRGICRQIHWYGKHCWEQGRRSSAAQPENGNRGGAEGTE